MGRSHEVTDGRWSLTVQGLVSGYQDLPTDQELQVRKTQIWTCQDEIHRMMVHQGEQLSEKTAALFQSSGSKPVLDREEGPKTQTSRHLRVHCPHWAR